MHQNFYVMYRFPNLLMFLILFYKFIISWFVSLNLFISAKQYFQYVCLCDVNKLTSKCNVKWQMAQLL